jgi:hypothetical protein
MVRCTCGKEFHACSSCYLSNSWEYTYCSEKCWHKSPEYIAVMDSLAVVLHNIKTHALADLMNILDQDSDYTAELVLRTSKELIDREEKT